MTVHRPPRRGALLAVATVSALAVTLAGCATDGGSATTDGDGDVTLTFLIDNSEATVDLVDALVADFESSTPGITVQVQTRPQGTEGDNVVKTKLATGEMENLFYYNSGSLLQALSPDQTLVDLADQEWTSTVDDTFTAAVSTEAGLYGTPAGTTMGGAILYNKDIYAELGLQVPTTWNEFMANSRAIADAGTAAPIVQTYGDTWTSQLFVLGDFFNVTAADPQWAEQYTANEVTYSQEPALAGFEHLQEVFESGLLNRDYASATFDDGIRMVATGEGAHYPMLTFAAASIEASYPEAVDTVGAFALPGPDGSANGLTVWMPAAVYIPQSTTGTQLDAAKTFAAYLASPAACEIIGSASSPTGPFVVDGCTLPDDVPAVVSDLQPYFDSGDTGLALEFLSAIKGPALEQITVSVGSGITTAQNGAAQYDDDVRKQAQQLGLPGWD